MKKPALLAVGLLAAACVHANIFETNATQRANLATAATWAQERAKAADPSSVLVRRALVADKAAGTVTVLAEACEILTGATVEFPIVGELSDRDYEAAFRTFAKPGDIAAALEWLGVPRGRNVSSSQMQYWAKGERVAIDVARVGGTNTVRRPIQSYLVDKSIGRAPTWESFVYCGSPDDPQSTNGVRLADAVAPNSVLATYNEPQSVLDTPVISNQSEVYERFVLAEGTPFEPFALYAITFTPETRADGLSRVKDVHVDFAVKDGKVFGALTSGAAKGDLEIPRLFETFKKLSADGFDPHATVSFGENLSVLQATVLARLLEKCEKEGNLRVGPPPEGSFYYKGFLPNEDWRAAKTRIAQPWEVHVPTNAAPLRLVQTIEDWSDKESLDPRLSTKEYSVATPEEAAKTMAAGDASLPPNLRLPVVLVFAAQTTPLSAVMPSVRALLPAHPIVYVFSE